MGKIHEFDPVIYPFRLWITYNATPKELNERFPNGGDNDGSFEKIPEGTGALTYIVEEEESGYSGILIRFANKSTIDFGFVCHEAGHAAFGLFHLIDENVDYEHQEPLCYILQFIGNCCKKVKSGNF